ncbi:hypothetical protein V5T82_06660 [Magnetovibrio sp. PR-2]|uniref:DUF805 domain-containing protein n=1 Tax=Magnetovibrio sp. PR-2 TaxID=3120356 RepID=UPI002FCE1900
MFGFSLLFVGIVIGLILMCMFVTVSLELKKEMRNFLTRKTFFQYGLFTYAISLVLGYGISQSGVYVAILLPAFAMGLTIVSSILVVRRLNDTKHSPKWAYLAIVGLALLYPLGYALIFLLCAFPTSYANRRPWELGADNQPA